MFISSGSLEDIVSWFRNGPFRYLLLFAGGGEQSAKFIGSVFDEKETIDLVSSEDIAVFLFYRDSKVAIELKGAGEGHLILLPGESRVPNRTNPFRPEPDRARAGPIARLKDSKL